MRSPRSRRSAPSASDRSASAPPRTSARPSRILLATLALALLVAATAAGCGGSSDDSGATEGGGQTAIDRFDSKRAFHLIEAQVAVGQRPAGSPQLRDLSETLRKMLP